MAGKEINVSIKGPDGSYKPFNLFQFFDDGIRKRTPARVAEKFRLAIIDNIDHNTFGFHLSEKWEERKRQLGADTRPFIMFRYYRDSISIVTENGRVAVGFKKTAMHPRAKGSIGDLAVHLEFGDISRGLPARPLWRRTAMQFFKENREEVMSVMRQSILDQTKRR